MSLITSISGIRGTLGGRPGENLTPPDIVRFTTSFGTMLRKQKPEGRLHVVVGRDARISGPMVSDLVCATLTALGIDVTDLGLSTTPTVELAVPGLRADGGIILTASHNPMEWNALKLLGPEGEFITAEQGETVLALASDEIVYAPVQYLGSIRKDDTWIARHIERVVAHPMVDLHAIQRAQFTVAVDPVNSSGAVVVPALLHALGVEMVVMIHGETNGRFAHNPEPLPAHLADLARITREQADLGIAVDPDVDRLALVCEDGSFFGEEYTLVAVADHVLSRRPGNTVSNLSSTQALGDVTARYGGKRFASAVGEVNVVRMMKEVQAVIGGEGNGGVILPDLHYGRDALIGIALFLTHLALSGKSASQLRQQYPEYHIAKLKVDLPAGMDVDGVLDTLARRFPADDVDRSDGLWVSLGADWVHLRKSNTEPIIRIYAESGNELRAQQRAEQMMEAVRACGK
ncbi:MAG TPA: phosphoglucosamine mutase [Bacteroidales bacterium]|nr:phosphoglucosamine mutase [Bacteroidales bacterium]